MQQEELIIPILQLPEDMDEATKQQLVMFYIY
jgi:hypothetical protein